MVTTLNKPLRSAIGNNQLLSLYGDHKYSIAATYNKVWGIAVKDTNSQLIRQLRQEMLQLHMEASPSDSMWRNKKEVT